MAKTLLNNTSIEPAKIEPDAAREGKTSPKTILIVDDDPAIMHYLQILLTRIITSSADSIPPTSSRPL